MSREWVSWGYPIGEGWVYPEGDGYVQGWVSQGVGIQRGGVGMSRGGWYVQRELVCPGVMYPRGWVSQRGGVCTSRVGCTRGVGIPEGEGWMGTHPRTWDLGYPPHPHYWYLVVITGDLLYNTLFTGTPTLNWYWYVVVATKTCRVK